MVQNHSHITFAKSPKNREQKKLIGVIHSELLIFIFVSINNY